MNRRNQSGLAGIDWMVFSLYLSLIGVGWLMIYTVGHGDGYPQSRVDFIFETTVGKQTIFIGVSAVLLLFTIVIDWKFWRTFAYLIYGASILSLILVLIFGKNINGATSWFALPGGFTLQPSEFAKFATCLALAAYLSTYSSSLREFRSQITAILMMLVPMVLIFLQPDAGSAVVFLSFFIVLYREGMPSMPYLFALALGTVFILSLSFEPLSVILGLLLSSLFVLLFNIKRMPIYYWLALLVWGVLSIIAFRMEYEWYSIAANVLLALGLMLYHWNNRQQRISFLVSTALVLGSLQIFATNFAFNNILRPHHQDRINVWLNPEKCDPQGSLYNVLQSKMAIGSGGLMGKGFTNGTMTKLNYVPEQSTDFIFCTIGEEQGFVGSFAIVVLFLLLLLRIVTIAERQRSTFSRQYAYGVAGVLFIHFFINIGMTMNLIPTIGIPLPFISYGGSSLLGFTLMIGVLLKLDSHRYSV